MGSEANIVCECDDYLFWIKDYGNVLSLLNSGDVLHVYFNIFSNRYVAMCSDMSYKVCGYSLSDCLGYLDSTIELKNIHLVLERE